MKKLSVNLTLRVRCINGTSLLIYDTYIKLCANIMHTYQVLGKNNGLLIFFLWLLPPHLEFVSIFTLVSTPWLLRVYLHFSLHISTQSPGRQNQSHISPAVLISCLPVLQLGFSGMLTSLRIVLQYWLQVSGTYHMP